MHGIAKICLVCASVAFPLFSAATPNLEYATYLGGSGEDNPASITRDFLGNIYVGGSTDSRDFPALGSHTFPATLHGEQQLCVVSRFSPDGTKLDFSMILPAPRPTLEPLVGASHLDRGATLSNGECRVTSIATDLWGTVYIAGVTTLVDPGDANHPAAVPAGDALGFVQKFQPIPAGDPSGPGLTLKWSKLFGDIPPPSGDRLHPVSSVTSINAVTTTRGGNLVIAGSTTSNFYPVVTGPVASGLSYQNALSGRESGVVTVLDSDGNVLNSTYLGIQDTADVQSTVTLGSVAVDSTGDIIVGGSFNHVDRWWWEIAEGYPTPSKYPMTPNAFVPIEVSGLLTLGGMVGMTDAVMTKLDPELSSVLYSVIDSGAGTCTASDALRIYHTTGERVAVDGNDNMYLLLSTNSPCMYTTDQAVQKQLSGLRDAMLLKVTPSGFAKGTATPAFAYQSYLGFGPASVTNHCALAVAPGLTTDVPDNVYVACGVVGARRKSLNNFSLSSIPREDTSAADAQPVFPGENLFVLRLESSDAASRVAYTAGFGGTYANALSDIVLDSTNTALYFAGSTLSADFPASSAAYDRSGSTQRDGVVGILDVTP